LSSPYSAPLRKLLDSVPGAIAVGFADYEGECIQLEGGLEADVHRLHLAYQGIVLHQLQAIHLALGETATRISSRYEDKHVIVQPLKSGYFVVLTLSPGANLFRAGQYLALTARELNQDL